MTNTDRSGQGGIEQDRSGKVDWSGNVCVTSGGGSVRRAACNLVHVTQVNLLQMFES